MDLVNDIKGFFREGSVLTRLIAINIAVYILINLLLVFLFLFGADQGIGSEIIHYFAVPANLSLLITKPWTIFTYMFVHEAFFHILFNMIMLYFGGRIFTEYLGFRRMLSTYILGGLAGAFFFILSYNIFPVFESSLPSAHAIGASASVLAIFVAIAAYIPDYTVHLMLIGPVRLKFIAIILVAIDLLSINKGNPGGHIAHLGGAFFGYIYITQLKKGRDWNNGFNFIAEKFSSLFKRKSKLKVAYKKRGVSDEEYRMNKVKEQERIDAILDKISKSGYDSLTKEEKETLFKMSNDKR